MTLIQELQRSNSKLVVQMDDASDILAAVSERLLKLSRLQSDYASTVADLAKQVQALQEKK